MRDESSTVSRANRLPRRSTIAAIAPTRGFWLPNFCTTRQPQSLPAHQITQSNLSIPGTAAAITRASPSLLPTAEKEPAARMDVLLPDSMSSSSG
jgi:hypothetical protein